jgi:hypothetical protein
MLTRSFLATTFHLEKQEHLLPNGRLAATAPRRTSLHAIIVVLQHFGDFDHRSQSITQHPLVSVSEKYASPLFDKNLFNMPEAVPQVLVKLICLSIVWANGYGVVKKSPASMGWEDFDL